MLNVCRMPYPTTETLRCESYTTPRSIDLENVTAKQRVEDVEEEREDSNLSSTKDARRKSRIKSAPAHFSPQVSENLTEKLLGKSEQCSLDDVLIFESSVFDDWSEAASGWREVVPYPKYVPQQPPSRHKSESACKKGNISGRTAVRCVDEDFGSDRYCPAWKANVEPVTYRYIPNNGYYRNNKHIRDVKEWLTIKRNKSEKSLVSPEVRHAQKTLKRDLESHFKGSGEENNAASTNVSSTPNGLAQNYQDLIAKRQQGATPQSQQDLRDRRTEFTNISKRLPAKEQQLMKSASDLFMEKFNTRLSALEKEICTPFNPVINKKAESASAGPNHSPTQITKKLRDVRVPETMKPTIQATKTVGDNFGDDLFTVTPMSKREIPLRPLEKLTPKQKQMEKSVVSSCDRSPSPEVPSPEDEEDNMVIMLAAATSQPVSSHKDAEACGINSARSAIAMTNFDIEQMRNIPLHLRPDVGSKPKSFFVQKGSTTSTLRRGAMRYNVTSSNGRTPEPTLMDGNVDMEDFVTHVNRPIQKDIDSVGATLPEIMGKRLSVITTSHRLL